MWHLGIVVVGFLVGLLTHLLMPIRHHSAGFLVAPLLGIVGALLATWGGQSLDWYQPGQASGLLAAVAGAVVVLALYRVAVRTADR